jgi:hypothetical protein
MKYIFDLHQDLSEHNLILAYEGEFTQEITKSILAMVERNMDSTGEDSTIKRKVFNVMVESLQNIVKHADNHGNTSHAAVFMVGKQKERYTIISGNSMDNKNIDLVKGKIDTVNDLDKDGLKAYYKEIIKNTKISEKGGAGLGFVDMARKSGQKLVYDFQDMGSGQSFFALKSSIERL